MHTYLIQLNSTYIAPSHNNSQLKGLECKDANTVYRRGWCWLTHLGWLWLRKLSGASANRRVGGLIPSFFRCIHRCVNACEWMKDVHVEKNECVNGLMWNVVYSTRWKSATWEPVNLNIYICYIIWFTNKANHKYWNTPV